MQYQSKRQASIKVALSARPWPSISDSFYALAGEKMDFGPSLRPAAPRQRTKPWPHGHRDVDGSLSICLDSVIVLAWGSQLVILCGKADGEDGRLGRGERHNDGGHSMRTGPPACGSSLTVIADRHGLRCDGINVHKHWWCRDRGRSACRALDAHLGNQLARLLVAHQSVDADNVSAAGVPSRRVPNDHFPLDNLVPEGIVVRQQR